MLTLDRARTKRNKVKLGEMQLVASVQCLKVEVSASWSSREF